MPWTKDVPTAAKVSNEDIKIAFWYEQANEADGTPAGIRARVRIDTEAGGQEAAQFITADELTAQEQTALTDLLIKLRDLALVERGFTES